MKKLLLTVFLVILLPLCFATTSPAWSGRKAILYEYALVKLKENEPYVWGKKDCSSQAWDMVKNLFPEYEDTKWFHRDRAEVMASWPFAVVMTSQQSIFGDFLFANSEDYPKSSKSSARFFKINHIMMKWVPPGKAIHAGKKRGFSETNLDPYWTPRLILITRPPY